MESNEQTINRLKSGDAVAITKPKIKAQEAEVARLKALVPAWTAFMKLSKDRPATEAKRTKLKSEQKSLSAQLEEQEKAHQKVAAAIEQLSPLLQAGEELTRLYNDACDLQKSITQVFIRGFFVGARFGRRASPQRCFPYDVTQADEQLKARASGTRTLELVQREYDQLEEANAALSKQVAELNAAVSRASERKQVWANAALNSRLHSPDLTCLCLAGTARSSESAERERRGVGPTRDATRAPSKG